MCPVCIASTAVALAGVGSTGGVLALSIDKWRKRVGKTSIRNWFWKAKEQ